MTRVLVGEFHPMVSVGLHHLFAGEGWSVVSDRRPLTPAVIHDVRPDAVVVDLDDNLATSAAEDLADDFPSLPIVECSSSTPHLRVFPAPRSSPSHDLPLTVDLLIRAVANS
jgi:hypothetical protein